MKKEKKIITTAPNKRANVRTNEQTNKQIENKRKQTKKKQTNKQKKDKLRKKKIEIKKCANNCGHIWTMVARASQKKIFGERTF